MSLPMIETDAQISQQLNKIQGQLSVLERKMDSLLSRMASLSNQPSSIAAKASSPVIQQAPVKQVVQQNNQSQGRQLYTNICADCKCECQLPFKPTNGRPVYCRDCFARRKNPPKIEIKIESKPAVSQPISMAKVALSVSEKKTSVKSKKKPVATKSKPAKKIAKKKIVKKSARR